MVFLQLIVLVTIVAWVSMFCFIVACASSPLLTKKELPLCPHWRICQSLKCTTRRGEASGRALSKWCILPCISFSHSCYKELRGDENVQVREARRHISIVKNTSYLKCVKHIGAMEDILSFQKPFIDTQIEEHSQLNTVSFCRLPFNLG